ncbi:aminomethyltransferase [Grosmannia clavigera kw1407]|uniref:Iron-sulfur cluster assembly factor IBA57 homolog, mitochondrial n=1 Tax=Grosmannia clavigera (strain kw1407 / UAMH 11150) TaxID=655863 RepID=F0XAL2_GROCL|nr:aminomethyltransferase [Grosmannia clavigera kw1407]EFX05261.1 aminomethyltransferase [Grosmannia clavigera kw1407]
MNTAFLAPSRTVLVRPTSACWRCRRSLRLHSSDAPGRPGQLLPPAPPSAGMARLASRRLISVAGPDAAKFLQGIITANMVPAAGASARPHGFYSAFLNSQGRVLHDVFVYRNTLSRPAVEIDPAFLVEVDAEQARTLEKHMRRYRLRAKVDVQLLDDDELAVWHAWGEGAASAAAAAAATASPDVITVCDTRAPGLGWRHVAASSGLPPPLALAVDAVDEFAYRIRRYLWGVAEGQREIQPGQALPLESNIDLMGGIDFHKGCYVGQELTIRTRHRGVVRKRVLPCVLYPDAENVDVPTQLDYAPHDISRDLAIPPETSIGRVGKKGRSAGKWLAGIGNVGLALCRLEPMTDIVLPDEAAATAAAAASSTPGTFVMAWPADEGTDQAASSVRIRAFVPEWLRQGLAPSS